MLVLNETKSIRSNSINSLKLHNTLLDPEKHQFLPFGKKNKFSVLVSI